MRTKTTFTTGIAVAATLALAGTASAATVEHVDDIGATPYVDAGEWATDATSDGTPTIDDEFGAPDGFGEDSIVLRTPENGDKAATLLNLAEPVDADAITAISYNVFRDADSTAADHLTPSIQMIVDFNGGTLEDGGFATMVYEPTYNGYPVADPIASDEWVFLDAFDDGQATWWSTRAVGSVDAYSFVSLQTYLDANPDMEVLRIGIGQGSGNPGLIAAVDGFTFNDTTYDFEVTAETCKDGGWETAFAAGTYRNQGQCIADQVSEAS